MTRSTTLSGGCMCGAIRYSARTTPAFSIHCHCTQCQKITGAGHASQFAMPLRDVEISGCPASYNLRADSGNDVVSFFCPTCGNPIYKKSSGYPQFIFFHASTLDDPELFQPQRAVWTATRRSWDGLDPSLPSDP